MRHGVESIHNHTHVHNNIDFFSKKHIHNNIDFFSKKHIHNNIDFFSKKHIKPPFQCLCMLIALLKFTSGTHLGMNNPPVVLFLGLSDTFFFGLSSVRLWQRMNALISSIQLVFILMGHKRTHCFWHWKFPAQQIRALANQWLHYLLLSLLYSIQL